MHKQVLFLCTHNASRSIMAEALVNHYLGDQWQAFSAGSAPTQVNLYSIRALRELGIEIPEAKSKPIDYFSGQKFDRVFTLCDDAREACPLWLGSSHVEHIGFPDPSVAEGNDLDKLRAFRDVRDQIKATIFPLLEM
ncbi:MAG TPA: arsenate reductase [candidate division Zixibacteria bacterium]|nr:arsenate reductase [candidate division Zixibacteria bacterium]HBZ00830.1 arsenate reductase [candidate division Zixibacteria bacterium]